VSDIVGRPFAFFSFEVYRRYTAPDVDATLLRGELDARANNAASVLGYNPDWVDKGVMNFHAILKLTKGTRHPKLGHLPEVESCAKSENERSLLTMWRVFRFVGVRLTLSRPERPRTA